MAVNGRAGLHLPGPDPLQHFARGNVPALVVLMDIGVGVMEQ